VELELTFDPPWTRDLMSEEAKLELGFLWWVRPLSIV
jgi:metal-sulfur cluster biosynthetic enzyme